jgi:hypothetical protein
VTVKVPPELFLNIISPLIILSNIYLYIMQSNYYLKYNKYKKKYLNLQNKQIGGMRPLYTGLNAKFDPTIAETIAKLRNSKDSDGANESRKKSSSKSSSSKSRKYRKKSSSPFSFL